MKTETITFALYPNTDRVVYIQYNEEGDQITRFDRKRDVIDRTGRKMRGMFGKKIVAK